VVKDDPLVKILPATEFIVISRKIEDELAEFLKQHYSLNNSKSPAHSLVGDWKTKATRLDTVETLLFDKLHGIPTLILESDVLNDDQDKNKDQFRLRFLWWDADAPNPSSPINDIRLPWRQTSNLSNFLSTLHRICAGLLIDEYYLFHYGICPKLPEILTGLVQELPNETAQQLMNLVVSRYRSVLEKMREERPSWIPQLALELAEVLSQLPNQNWARDQVNFSMEVLASLTMDIEGKAA